MKEMLLEKLKMLKDKCVTLWKDFVDVLKSDTEGEKGWSLSNLKKLPLIPYAPIAAGAVTFIILIILMIALGSSGAYKKPIKSYCKALQKGKVEKLVNLTIPKDCQEVYFKELEQFTDIKKEEYLESQANNLKAQVKDVKKLKVKIVEAEKMNKLKNLKEDMSDYSVSDLKTFITRVGNDFGAFDIEKTQIKQAYAVKVKIQYELNGKKQEFTDVNMVYKYKGDWYLYKPFGLK